MSQFDYKLFYRRNLPHIQPLGATFFVTFRLAGSLPQFVLERWKQEKRWHEAMLSRITDKEEQARWEREWKRRWFRRFEAQLDKAQSGPMWLKDERIAELVSESLHYRDGKVYRLDAYCIMPNHVHVVFAPLVTQSDRLRYNEQSDRLHYNEQSDRLHYEQSNRLRYEQSEGLRYEQSNRLHYEQSNRLRYECYSLARILHSLKGYTAWKANRVLGRRGAFWEHESYDHYVRDQREWERIIAYVLNNPVKAGLVRDWQEWRWSYYRYAVQHDL